MMTPGVLQNPHLNEAAVGRLDGFVTADNNVHGFCIYCHVEARGLGHM